MCDVSELFYKVDGKEVEGYLGKPEECEILFVLKEPNDSNPQGFWFKNNVVDKCEVEREGQKYYKSLGSLAYMLLDISNEHSEDLTEALRKCAYININYKNGGPKASIDYKRTLNYLHFLNRKQDKKWWKVYPDYQKRAEEILEIIKRIKCKYIVTTWDIFNALVGEKLDTQKDHHEGIVTKNRIFRIAAFNEHKYILSFDPYRGLDYRCESFAGVNQFLSEHTK